MPLGTAQSPAKPPTSARTSGMRVIFANGLMRSTSLAASIDVHAGFAIRDRSHRGKALVVLARRDNTPGLAPPYPSTSAEGRRRRALHRHRDVVGLRRAVAELAGAVRAPAAHGAVVEQARAARCRRRRRAPARRRDPAPGAGLELGLRRSVRELRARGCRPSTRRCSLRRRAHVCVAPARTSTAGGSATSAGTRESIVRAVAELARSRSRPSTAPSPSSRSDARVLRARRDAC